jgi:hypothetical protein
MFPHHITFINLVGHLALERIKIKWTTFLNIEVYLEVEVPLFMAADVVQTTVTMNTDRSRGETGIE